MDEDAAAKEPLTRTQRREQQLSDIPLKEQQLHTKIYSVVPCPQCREPIGEPCLDLGAKKTGRYQVKLKPHAGRQRNYNVKLMLEANRKLATLTGNTHHKCDRCPRLLGPGEKMSHVQGLNICEDCIRKWQRRFATGSANRTAPH